NPAGWQPRAGFKKELCQRPRAQRRLRSFRESTRGTESPCFALLPSTFQRFNVSIPTGLSHLAQGWDAPPFCVPTLGNGAVNFLNPESGCVTDSFYQIAPSLVATKSGEGGLAAVSACRRF